MLPIKPKTVNFTVYILDKNWNAKRIKFPFTLKSGVVLNIYSIDKVTDVFTKIYIITGVPPPMYHMRGLNIPFDDWVEQQKPNPSAFISEDIKDAHSTKKKTPKYLQLLYSANESTKHIGYIDPSANTHADYMWPTLTFRNSTITTDTPIHALTSPYMTPVRTVPSDNQYIQLQELENDASDMFISELAPYSELVIIPLDTFIKPKTPQSSAIVNDIVAFERVYYGFIFKYYPLFNISAFKVYLNGAYQDYINTNKIREFENIAAIETDILTKISSAKYSKLTSDKIMGAFNIFITKAELSAKPATPSNYLLRNIFDKLHIVNRKLNVGYMRLEMRIVPSLIGRSGTKPVQVIVQKYRIGEYIGRITNQLKSPTSLMFAMLSNKDTADASDAATGDSKRKIAKTYPQYMYLSDTGLLSFKTIWPEVSEMTLEDVVEEIHDRCTNVFAEINKHMPYYGRIKFATEPKLTVGLMDIIMTWPVEISARDFKQVRDAFREYIEVGFAEYVSAVIFEVKWTRSMRSPCLIKFIHRSTFIRIEITGIYINDFNVLLPFLYIYLTGAIDEIKAFNKKIEIGTTNHDDNLELRRIKKLRENDSILYDNLKPGMIYSKKCQGIRQPNYITEQEYKTMPKHEKADVTAYWNFTYGRPAYYTCQSDKSGAPLTFSFLTGIHESEFCVPCCKRKPVAVQSKQARRDIECINNHTCPPVMAARAPSKSAYVMVTNKELPPARIGELPDSVRDILGSNMYTMGIEQYIPAIPDTPAQIAFSISAALNMSISDYIISIIKNVNAKANDSVIRSTKYSLRHPHNVATVGGEGTVSSPCCKPLTAAPISGGMTSEYAKSLTTALTEIFVNRVEFYTFPMSNWIEFFIFQTLEIYNINVVIFRIKTGDLILLENNLPKILIVEYIFPETQYNTNITAIAYYPIYKINPRVYYSTSSKVVNDRGIECRVFIEPIAKLDASSNQPDVIMLNNIIDRFGTGAVSKLFMNLNNKCYAVLLNDEVYFPIGYSNVYPGLPLSYDAYDPQTTTCNLLAIKTILDTLKIEPTSAITFGDDIVQALVILGINMYIWAPLSEVSNIWSNIEYKKTTVNYIDVNIAIMSGRSSDKKYFELVNMGLYKNNIYDIIKIELLNAIDIKAITLDKLRLMSLESLADLIPHTISDKAALTANIILPCKINPENAQCDGSALIVPTNYMQYIELIKKEIDDPVINFIKATPRSIVMNMLDFEKISGERVLINIQE